MARRAGSGSVRRQGSVVKQNSAQSHAVIGDRVIGRRVVVGLDKWLEVRGPLIVSVFVRRGRQVNLTLWISGDDGVRNTDEAHY